MDRLRWMLTVAALVYCVLTACSAALPRADQLFATLPTQTSDVTFDQRLVVDDQYRLGHSIDAPLAALGKSRSDATIVFRGSDASQASVGAVEVTDVSGDQLLDAIATTWEAAAVIDRRREVVGGHDAWLLTIRNEGVIAAYQKGNVVYLAQDADEGKVAALLENMP